jgi:hypothetical protein
MLGRAVVSEPGELCHIYSLLGSRKGVVPQNIQKNSFGRAVDIIGLSDPWALITVPVPSPTPNYQKIVDLGIPKRVENLTISQSSLE